MWSGLAEQAQYLKSPGVIKRFFTGDATAKKLEGLIRDINSSMQEFLVSGGWSLFFGIQSDASLVCRCFGNRLYFSQYWPSFTPVQNVEEIVHCMREDTTAILQDVGAVCKEVSVVRDGVNIVCEDARTLRKDVELVHEDLVLLQQDVKDVRAPSFLFNDSN